MSKRILIPTDFSESSLAAIRLGLERMEGREGVIFLLHVVEGDPVRRYVVDGPPPWLIDYFDVRTGLTSPPLRQRVIYRDLYEEAQWKLADLSPRRSRNRVQTIVRVGKVADEIVRVAREQDADLILMGTRRRSAWRRLFRKGVVEKVRRKASIPVIQLEAPQRETATSQGAEGSGVECCRERMVHATDEMTSSPSFHETRQEAEALPKDRAHVQARSRRRQGALQRMPVGEDEQICEPSRR